MFNAWRVVKAKRRRDDDFRSQKRSRTARQKVNPQDKYDKDDSDRNLNVTDEEIREQFNDLENHGEYLQSDLWWGGEHGKSTIADKSPVSFLDSRVLNADQYGVKMDEDDMINLATPSLSNKISGVSASDKNKGKGDLLFEKMSLISSTLLALKNSNLKDGYDVYILPKKVSYGVMPDRVAEEILKELNTFKGADKRIFMNKQGQRANSPAKYIRTIEPSKPSRPHVDETFTDYMSSASSNRWTNEPSEEDKEKWGWMQQLEQTDDMEKYDWEVQFLSAAFNEVWDKEIKMENRRDYQGYATFAIAIFHGNMLHTFSGVKCAIAPIEDKPPRNKLMGNIKDLDWRTVI
jgi:hypothetical protein